MAEVSRGRGIFGRLLTAFGFVWLLWSFFGELVTLELGATPIDLPLLPGFVFLFLGRALSRGARRRPIESTSDESPRPQSRRPAQPRVQPKPSPRESILERPEPVVEDQVMIEEVMVQALETDEAPVSEGTAARKSSAEMVAEARQRFNRRPV